jgi:segregation and condensation protein A
MNFELQLQEFKGPIESLLGLIEKRKLPINDISLVEVTDEYLSMVSSLKDTEETLSYKIHFVYVASTLALIKSKSLLPNIHLTEEEETDILELKRRLSLYQHYQDIGMKLKKSISNLPHFALALDRPKEVSFQPHESMSTESLIEALGSVLNEVPETPQTKKEGYIKIAVHIEEIMDTLIDRIKESPRLDFKKFITTGASSYEHSKEQKVYAVVSFLALLEVVRNHGLDVEQSGLFEEITLTN